jgi:hypothetical protein
MMVFYMSFHRTPVEYRIFFPHTFQMFIEHLLAFDKVHCLIGRLAPFIAFAYPSILVWWVSVATLMCWSCLKSCPLLDIEKKVLGHSQTLDEGYTDNSTRAELYMTLLALSSFIYVGYKVDKTEPSLLILLFYLLKNGKITPTL